MTIQETARLMDILTAAYPQFYGGRGAPDPEQALALWAGMFEEDDFAVVAAAVKALIACDERGFPPHIGAVKVRIRQITQPVEMTEGEAWALVHRAIRGSAYGSQAAFDRLPPVLQRLVGAPSQLRDWALMDGGTVQSVVASNFQRTYRARAAADREWAALPGDVKALAESLAAGLTQQPEPEVKTLHQMRRELLEAEL